MKIPFIKKFKNEDKLYFERVLPVEGEIFLKVGDTVAPFTPVGSAKIGYFENEIDFTYKLLVEPDTYVEKGIQIGQKETGFFKNTKLFAPYNGFVRKTHDKNSGITKYKFEQEKEKMQILAGAWGVVENVQEKKGILISAPAKTIYCAVSTNVASEGELIVLPNPPELLEDPYFNDYTKDLNGKIIYSGYFIKLENLKKAIQQGVRGVIAGGASKATFDYATKHNFFLGLLSGYGRIPTPSPLYDFLAGVVNRYVFLRGSQGKIIIPLEVADEKKGNDQNDFLIEIESGMIVQVLERPYFGWVGTVENFDNNLVQVKLYDSNDAISVKHSNLLALNFE